MAKASATPIVETAPEIWRPVAGFEGLYEVSNHGHVRRLIGRGRWGNYPLPKPRMLAYDYGNGYKSVTLSNAPIYKTENVHTLVAQAFIGPRHLDTKWRT